MAQRYIVTLIDPERAHLLTLIKKGKVSARKLNRVHTLHQAGATDAAIAADLHLGIAPVERLRTRFVEEGLEAALTEHARPGGRWKRDGRQEACLIAPACRTPPEGRQCWTMQRLADTLVALRVVDAIADETVRCTLKKMLSSRGRRRAGGFPV